MGIKVKRYFHISSFFFLPFCKKYKGVIRLSQAILKYKILVQIQRSTWKKIEVLLNNRGTISRGTL